MSALPNSAAYLTPEEPNEEESFAHFFESWMDEQTMLLQELRHSVSNSKPTSEEEESVLVPLIKRVMDHYNEYYIAKLKGGETEILSMLSPSWTSSLEDSFYWIGGWRPTTALQLLYSKSTSQFAARVEDIILEGVDTGDLGDLSPDQHRRIEELELKTIKQERKVTAKMAKHQETVATTEMVELSQIPSDMENEDQVNSAVTEKEEGLKKNLEKADRLRWKTLKAVVRILEPCEPVHFLIGAAQLHLKIREWGYKKDDENHTSKATHHENASGSGTQPDDQRS